MEDITFTINLTVILKWVLVYVLVCIPLMVAYAIYEIKRGSYDRGRKSKAAYWSKKMLKAVLLSPLFPLVVVEIIQSRRAVAQYRKRRAEEKEEAYI